MTSIACCCTRRSHRALASNRGRPDEESVHRSSTLDCPGNPSAPQAAVWGNTGKGLSALVQAPCQGRLRGALKTNHARATQLAMTVPQKMVRNGCFGCLVPEDPSSDQRTRPAIREGNRVEGGLRRAPTAPRRRGLVSAVHNERNATQQAIGGQQHDGHLIQHQESHQKGKEQRRGGECQRYAAGTRAACRYGGDVPHLGCAHALSKLAEANQAAHEEHREWQEERERETVQGD